MLRCCQTVCARLSAVYSACCSLRCVPNLSNNRLLLRLICTTRQPPTDSHQQLPWVCVLVGSVPVCLLGCACRWPRNLAIIEKLVRVNAVNSRKHQQPVLSRGSKLRAIKASAAAHAFFLRLLKGDEVHNLCTICDTSCNRSCTSPTAPCTKH